MSRGSNGSGNPVITGAMTFLVAGLNALLNESATAQTKVEGAVELQGNNDFGYISKTTDTYAQTAFSNYFHYIQLTNNSWQDVSKSYTIPFNSSGTTKQMGFDVLMVSSCAVDSSGKNQTGICRLVAVAYVTGAWRA